MDTAEKDAMAMYCTGPIVKWDREADEDGGEWIKFHCEAGGTVMVYTKTPLVWVAGRDEGSVN